MLKNPLLVILQAQNSVLLLMLLIALLIQNLIADPKFVIYSKVATAILAIHIIYQ